MQFVYRIRHLIIYTQRSILMLQESCEKRKRTEKKFRSYNLNAIELKSYRSRLTKMYMLYSLKSII